MEIISAKNAFIFAINSLIKNFRIIVVVNIVMLFFAWLTKALLSNFNFVALIILLIASIALSYLYLGIIKIYLNIYNKKSVGFSDLLYPPYLFLRYLAGMILLLGIIVFFITAAIGIMFILPNIYFLNVTLCFFLILYGIYFSIQFIFYPVLIIDRKYKVIQSFKISRKITLGRRLEIFKFLILTQVPIGIMTTINILFDLSTKVIYIMNALSYILSLIISIIFSLGLLFFYKKLEEKYDQG